MALTPLLLLQPLQFYFQVDVGSNDREGRGQEEEQFPLFITRVYGLLPFPV